MFSSMSPIEGLVGRSIAISASPIRPGLAWGYKEVSALTSADISATYSMVDAKPLLGQECSRLWPPILGPIAKGEQGLGAPGLIPGLGHRQHLVGLEVDATGAGWLGKRAIGAAVPTQRGQRDEHLAAVGDSSPVALVAELARPRRTTARRDRSPLR